MAAEFVPNQNADATIAAKAPGNVFAAGMDPWLGQTGSLYCLRLCSLSLGQAKVWITGKGFYEMISFIEIIPDEVQGIGKMIMAATTDALWINRL